MTNPFPKGKWHCITPDNHRQRNITRANTIFRGDIERIAWKQTNVPLKYCQIIIKEAVKQIVYHVALGHKFNIPRFGFLRRWKHYTRVGRQPYSVRLVYWKRREEEFAEGSTPAPIVKVPTRHRYVKSYKTEIEENLENAKPDKWGKKKKGSR